MIASISGVPPKDGFIEIRFLISDKEQLSIRIEYEYHTAIKRWEKVL